MKNKTITVFIALLLALVLIGCKAKDNKPSLEIISNDDNTVSIAADKAGISVGGSADIAVSEGQKLVIESTLSKGEIQIKFFREEAPANPDDTMDAILHTNDSPALDITVSTAGTAEYAVDPGNYTIMVNTLKTATGTVSISAK